MTPALTDIAQRDTVRLISTGRLKEPALLPLAANQGAFDDLASLEDVTNRQQRAQAGGLPELPPQELVYGRAGVLFINAAFTHTGPGGNRFNDARRGAWYCGFDADTLLAEVGYHLTRELEAIGRFENATDYAELLADFIGPFYDLRAADRAQEPCLHRDPTIGYPAGQKLARELRTGGSNGVIYPSVATPAAPAWRRSGPTWCRTCARAASGGSNGRARARRRSPSRPGTEVGHARCGGGSDESSVMPARGRRKAAAYLSARVTARATLRHHPSRRRAGRGQMTPDPVCAARLGPPSRLRA
jgi:hypothetical protein